MSNQPRKAGRFSTKVSDQAILVVFERSEAPFLTAPELAAEFDMTRQAITGRLKRMEDEGLVGHKQTGARSVGWWAEQEAGAEEGRQ